MYMTDIYIYYELSVFEILDDFETFNYDNNLCFEAP